MYFSFLALTMHKGITTKKFLYVTRSQRPYVDRIEETAQFFARFRPLGLDPTLFCPLSSLLFFSFFSSLLPHSPSHLHSSLIRIYWVLSIYGFLDILVLF